MALELPPNTLYQICVGVQRYLRENGFEGLNIFQDSQYKAFQDSLDARMKNDSSFSHPKNLGKPCIVNPEICLSLRNRSPLDIFELQHKFGTACLEDNMCHLACEFRVRIFIQ